MQQPIAKIASPSLTRRAVLIAAAALSLTGAAVTATHTPSLGASPTGDATTLIDKTVAAGSIISTGGGAHTNGRGWG
jgi:hypothetical protein